MIFKRSIELEKGRLDIAPLIDVIFLLLIFFMLTSNFIAQQGIKVNLPGAVTSISLPGEDFIIDITRENKVMINSEAVALDKLHTNLDGAAKQDKDILIRADRDASMGKVVNVWDLCRDAGINNVNIATKGKE